MDSDPGSLVCQYGMMCYRKNPIHFQEYSHPELEAIVMRGRNSKNEFVIPDDILMPEEDTKQQLNMIEKILKIKPKPVTESNAKTATIPPGISIQVLGTTAIMQSAETKKVSNNDDATISLDNSDEAEVLAKRPKLSEPSKKMTSMKLDSWLTSGTPKRSKSIAAAERKHELVYMNDPIKLDVQSGLAKSRMETLSISLPEILDNGLGDLETSVQINFQVDVVWLIHQYSLAGHDSKPMLILYGVESAELMNINTVRSNVTAIKIEMTGRYASHHTKMMLLGYKDKSLRVVVGSANLFGEDWLNRTQGLWISPRCYEIEDQSNYSSGESVTGFKADLIRYLNSYDQPRLMEWINRIERTNFEAVKVFLICSVPGSHQTLENDPKWGHLRVGHLLAKHCAPVGDSCPLVGQSSTIGHLGKSINEWIADEILSSFGRDSGPPRLKRPPNFKFIFPTYGNVSASHGGILGGGGCLPYRRETHANQTWLIKHFQQWRADQRNRSKAIPHIKSYCRYSEKEGIYWFCLTSANLSRAAWGTVIKGQKPGIHLNNYEAGVLFLPKFLANDTVFPLKPVGEVAVPFPMPYDLPLVPYGHRDEPFFYEHFLKLINDQSGNSI